MKLKIAVAVLTVIFLLASCSVQTDFDVFDFCERYNFQKGEKLLSTDSFLSDENGGMYCFLTTGNSRLLLTLETLENGTVNSVYVTAQKDEFALEDAQTVIEEIKLIFSAYCYSDALKAQENLSLIGFDGEFEPFSNLYKSEKSGKHTYTLYSNSFSFTVCAEKIASD